MRFVIANYGIGLLMGCLCLGGVSAQTPEKEPAEETRSYWDRLREAAEKAVETGQDKSEEAREWAESDIAKIGDWEYHLLQLSGADPSAWIEALNDKGTERWECFWVQPTATGANFWMRRPALSYLQRISTGDLLKLLSLGSALSYGGSAQE